MSLIEVDDILNAVIYHLTRSYVNLVKFFVGRNYTKLP